jgi:hypothetical protein
VKGAVLVLVVTQVVSVGKCANCNNYFVYKP